MKVKIGKSKNTNPRDKFVVEVETMTGDADDNHKIEIECDDDVMLRDVIIHAEVMKKCFPQGRGGYDNYIGPYFEKYFENELFSDDMGCLDSIESYTVKYYDKGGNKCPVKIEMDDEMKEEIKHPKMTPEQLEEMEYK